MMNQAEQIAALWREIERLKHLEFTVSSAGVTDATTLATANTIAKRDANGATALNGVKFPASPVLSADPNMLDAFEEGDWTPIWLGTTTNPTVTYTAQQGHYVRVGGMVTFTGTITISAVGVAGAGNLRLGGLPFTISSNQGYRGSMFFGYAFGFTANTPTAGIPIASTTAVGLFGYNAADARTDRATFTLASALTATTVVFFAGSYAV